TRSGSPTSGWYTWTPWRRPRERPGGHLVPAGVGAVRLDVRRGGAGEADPDARGPRGVHRGLLCRAGAQRAGPGIAGVRVPLPEPADRPVLHRGGRTRGHGGG